MKPLLFTNIDNKAEDTSVLHITGNEDVAGTKNFSTAPKIGGSNTAKDSDVVHKSGDTITGSLYFQNYNGISTSDQTNRLYMRSSNGSYIALCGNKDESGVSGKGGFDIVTQIIDEEGTSTKNYLSGFSDGKLKWRGSNIITAEGGTDHGVINGSLTCSGILKIASDSLYCSDSSQYLHIRGSRNNEMKTKKFGSIVICNENYDVTNAILLRANDPTGSSNGLQMALRYDGKVYMGSVELPCPPCTVIWEAMDSAPSGYLLCNGGAVSRTTYSRLFSAIGTKYGAGDSSTTFNVPNLIGRVAWGATTAGTYYSAGLPNITGGIIIDVSGYGRFGVVTNSGAGKALESDSSYTVRNPATLSTITHNSGFNLNASRSSSIYGNSSTVQPPALTLVPYIKY